VIRALRAVGPVAGFVTLWLTAWLTAWMFAFPIAYLAPPFARRVARTLLVRE
jgi:hypothetical protein